MQAFVEFAKISLVALMMVNNAGLMPL